MVIVYNLLFQIKIRGNGKHGHVARGAAAPDLLPPPLQLTALGRTDEQAVVPLQQGPPPAEGSGKQALQQGSLHLL